MPVPSMHTPAVGTDRQVMRTMAGKDPGTYPHEPSKAQRAELIARLVGRVRRRDYIAPADVAAATHVETEAEARALEVRIRELLWIENMANYVVHLDEGPTIDATPLWGGRRREVFVEDCECLFSPWPHASMFTVNPDGKGVVGTWFWSSCREDYDTPEMQAATARVPDSPGGAVGPARSWDDVMWRHPELVDQWDDIAQVVQGFTWMGGPINDDKGRQTGWNVKGPLWTVSLAVDYDGKLRATQALRYMPTWSISEELAAEMAGSDLALLVLTLDFLNLRNIEVAPSSGLPRPVAKRLAREGVQVSELTILPVGKYRRSDRDRTVLGEGMPFTPVRGHPIRSGIDGRKHLFGYDGQDGRPLVEGRFWVAAHAKGRRDVGEVIQEFTLADDDEIARAQCEEQR